MQSSAKHLFQTGNYSLVTALCVFFPILVSISWVFPILSTLVIAGLAEREARTPRDLGLWSLALLCTVFFSPMAWTQNYVFTLPALACALSSLRERGLSLSKRLRSPLFIVVAVFVCVSQLMQYDTVGKSAYEALIRARYHLWASLLLCLGLFHARRRFGLSDRGRPITFH